MLPRPKLATASPQGVHGSGFVMATEAELTEPAGKAAAPAGLGWLGGHALTKATLAVARRARTLAQSATAGPSDSWERSDRADRSIAISLNVMALVDDAAAGILLSQLIYWTRRGVDVIDRDGWVHKTAAEWEHETGMSWKVQRRARAKLERLGLLEERKRTMPARLEFRLKLAALGQLLAQRSDVEIGVLDLATFTSMDAPLVERLLGRGFLYRSALARVFPVHSAMMCSRLLAGLKLPTAGEPAARHGAARLVAMHRERWRSETGLSRDQWQTARRNLLDAQVLIERKHNFPRRVDLAVDLDGLAQALAQGGKLPLGRAGFGEAGLDRAKQVGGNGHRPIPPSLPRQANTESPDPADKDRPIQPLVIARSHLYYRVDDLDDPQLHPPRERQAGNGGFRSFGSGGGGWVGTGYSGLKIAFGQPDASGQKTGLPGQTANSRMATQAATLPEQAEPPAVALGTLVWPKCFTEEDRDQAGRHMAGLDRAKQQELLDEIDWLHRGDKPVRSPVALTRTLVKRIVSDTFVPDGAHRVAAARRQAAEEEQRLRAEAAARAERAPRPREPLTPDAEAARQRLKELSEQAKRGRVA